MPQSVEVDGVEIPVTIGVSLGTLIQKGMGLTDADGNVVDLKTIILNGVQNNVYKTYDPTKVRAAFFLPTCPTRGTAVTHFCLARGTAVTQWSRARDSSHHLSHAWDSHYPVTDPIRLGCGTGRHSHFG